MRRQYNMPSQQIQLQHNIVVQSQIPNVLNKPNHQTKQRFYFNDSEQVAIALGKGKKFKKQLQLEETVRIWLKQDPKNGLSYFEIKSECEDGDDVDRVIVRLNGLLRKYKNENRPKINQVFQPQSQVFRVQSPRRSDQYIPQQYPTNRNVPTYAVPTYGLSGPNRNVTTYGPSTFPNPPLLPHLRGPPPTQNQLNQINQRFQKRQVLFKGVLENQQIKKKFDKVKEYITFARTKGTSQVRFKVFYQNKIQFLNWEQEEIKQATILGYQVSGILISVNLFIESFEVLLSLKAISYRKESEKVQFLTKSRVLGSELYINLSQEESNIINVSGYIGLEKLYYQSKKSLGLNAKWFIINQQKQFQKNGSQNPLQLIITGISSPNKCQQIAKEVQFLFRELPPFQFKMISEWAYKDYIVSDNIRSNLTSQEIFYFSPKDANKIIGKDFANLVKLRNLGVNQVIVMIDQNIKGLDEDKQKCYGLQLKTLTVQQMMHCFYFLLALQKEEQKIEDCFDMDNFFKNFCFQVGNSTLKILDCKKRDSILDNYLQNRELSLNMSDISSYQDPQEQEQNRKTMLQLMKDLSNLCGQEEEQEVGPRTIQIDDSLSFNEQPQNFQDIVYDESNNSDSRGDRNDEPNVSDEFREQLMRKEREEQIEQAMEILQMPEITQTIRQANKVTNEFEEREEKEDNPFLAMFNFIGKSQVQQACVSDRKGDSLFSIKSNPEQKRREYNKR